MAALDKHDGQCDSVFGQNKQQTVHTTPAPFNDIAMDFSTERSDIMGRYTNLELSDGLNNQPPVPRAISY